jgi:hypothetical protein
MRRMLATAAVLPARHGRPGSPEPLHGAGARVRVGSRIIVVGSGRAWIWTL